MKYEWYIGVEESTLFRSTLVNRIGRESQWPQSQQMAQIMTPTWTCRKVKGVKRIDKSQNLKIKLRGCVDKIGSSVTYSPTAIKFIFFPTKEIKKTFIKVSKMMGDKEKKQLNVMVDLDDYLHKCKMCV